MRFGTLMESAFKDPKPTYEFTRSKFTWVINEYIRGNLMKSVGSQYLGVSGTIEYPPAPPVPYQVPPSSGPTCGAVINVVCGTVSEDEYDTAAKKSAVIGSFWENLFELIGRGTLRSILTIMPIVPNAGSNLLLQTSSPMVYTSATLESDGSYYKTPGNSFSASKVLSDWRSSGSRFFESISGLQITDPSILREKLSEAVSAAARECSTVWRRYRGALKQNFDEYPGAFDGYIYGSINYD